MNFKDDNDYGYVSDAVNEFLNSDKETIHTLRNIQLQLLLYRYYIALDEGKADTMESFIKGLDYDEAMEKYRQLFGNYAYGDHREQKSWFANSLLNEVSWMIKHTKFFEGEGIDLSRDFKSMLHIYGEICGPEYYICPDCGTIVIEKDDTEYDYDQRHRHIFCPICNGVFFKDNLHYDFVDKTNPEWKYLIDQINRGIGWDKKYYFRIGNPDKQLHIGKWYPCLKIKNSAYSEGYKHYYIHLGFYPFRVWLGIVYLPAKIKVWFLKKFRPQEYKNRLDRLFKNELL